MNLHIVSCTVLNKTKFIKQPRSTIQVLTRVFTIIIISRPNDKTIIHIFMQMTSY
jgi:hypothetical protein